MQDFFKTKVYKGFTYDLHMIFLMKIGFSKLEVWFILFNSLF